MRCAAKDDDDTAKPRGGESVEDVRERERERETKNDFFFFFFDFSTRVVYA